MPLPAAFLDRDGTLIREAEYVSSPDRVLLFPDAAPTIARLNALGIPVIVVTNQSGIARGYFTVEQYRAVERRLDELLIERGARIDGTYFCPHHPDFTGPCECRKPGVALFRLAAVEHDLDLSRSVYIGDRWRDAAPALAFGGRGIVVPIATTAEEEIAAARQYAELSDSLSDAVDRWLTGRDAAAHRGTSPDVSRGPDGAPVRFTPPHPAS